MKDDRRTDSIRKEAAFFDRLYSASADEFDINPRMYRMYAQPMNAWHIRERANMFLGDVGGRRLLDYGCGIGEEAVYFAKLGADVYAIDISPVAVAITRKRALHNGVEARVHAFVMDCTRTAFKDHSFDLIHGLGILHHIGLQAGFGEVKRLLAPGGKAVFLEHMGNSDLIEGGIKRWLGIPQKYYSEQERPLKWRDCLEYRSWFAHMEMYPYCLIGRLRRVIPWLGRRAVRRLDHQILTRLPWLRHWASGLLICIEA